MLNKKYNQKVTIYGSSKDIEYATTILDKVGFKFDESIDRQMISPLIDVFRVKAHILYNGNSVYGVETILNKFKKLFKSGDMKKLTNDCYDFLHLHCGSIAHYNKFGWISEYPTISDLRKFFQKNEFGHPITDQPGWNWDTKEICKELIKL